MVIDIEISYVGDIMRTVDIEYGKKEGSKQYSEVNFSEIGAIYE